MQSFVPFHHTMVFVGRGDISADRPLRRPDDHSLRSSVRCALVLFCFVFCGQFVCCCCCFFCTPFGYVVCEPKEGHCLCMSGPPTEIFGLSLVTALERANSEGLPAPVRDTITWLNNNALHEVEYCVDACEGGVLKIRQMWLVVCVCSVWVLKDCAVFV